VSASTSPPRTRPRTFAGVLFPSPSPKLVEREPEFFHDLNLDQFLDAILEGREHLRLAPFFYTPLSSVAEVEYRHGVVRDLADPGLRAGVTAFCAGMQATREALAWSGKIGFPIQKQARVLEAALAYVDAVRTLADALHSSPPGSQAFQSLSAYLTWYLDSPGFGRLHSEAATVNAELRKVTYRLKIAAGTVTVSATREEDDYRADVEETFARFREGAVKDYRSKLSRTIEPNHVEAHIIERLARLYPAPFQALERFSRDHKGFGDETVTTFDREVQFFLAFLEGVEHLGDGGLPICLPEVHEETSSVRACGAYDPVLAQKLLAEENEVVCNDFHLDPPERLLVVTGPNQGGKTTFARMFAVLHYLAALGLPVPARDAQLLLSDRIFTHFEHGENLGELTGKLQDDLVRIHGILAEATPRSLIAVNEIFTSTSLEDAVALGAKVLAQIVEVGALCVCVTFLDELAQDDESTVSMMSTVDPDDPVRRTFKVMRRPPDGLAYAEAIAHKYGVTYEALKRRLAR
jgi:hypothetical protein